ncbi:MAG: tyrosine protein kinase, partial [Flavobacteriaceae bacterium]
MSLLSPAEDQGVDLKEFLRSYTKHWKWFVFSIILALGAAYLYVRYATPQFVANAKIQIIDEKSSSSPLDLFQDLDIVGSGSSQIQDEIELINSRSNFVEVVQELDLNIKMLTLGNIVDTEIYMHHPVKLNFIVNDSILNNANFNFYLSLATSTTFGYSEEEDSPLKVHAFGKTINTPIGDLVVTPDIENIKRFKDKRIKVAVRPLHYVAQNYKNKIFIGQTDEYSNILNISLEDPIKEKAKDIINALIRIYNRNAIEDKKTIADRTSNFINERIADISQNLSSVDQSAQDLKTSRGLTDIQSEANINLNVGASNRQELANYQTQLEIAASMQDIVEQQAGYEVLPGNIGLNDPTIANTTEKYNQLVLERQRLLKSSTERSPIIQNLDQQLAGLKRSMVSSLNSTVNNLGMQVNTLSGQQAIINSKIYSAPRNERALRDITRQQQTTESLYLYLLQKREEAQIAVASTAPKSKIIDYAYNPTDFPVSPRRNLVFLASLLIGLFVPFTVIYTNDMLDNKVH